MAPNASFSFDYRVTHLEEQPPPFPQQTIECEVCDTFVDRAELVEHLEACAHDSSAPYMLKMMFLHQAKLENIEKWIDLNYKLLCDGHPLQLPKGICYHCPNPEDHRNERCKHLTRLEYLQTMLTKTEEDYQWHFTEAQRFLTKTQIEMLSLKQRRYLDDYFKKIEGENSDPTSNEPAFTAEEKEYPASTCAEIRSIERRNNEKMRDLQEDVERKSRENYIFQMEKRRNRHEEMIDYLTIKDRVSPDFELEFA
ncbi:hypothetical protein B9Z55_026275 [Caenorhabditis nigoni]|nr:hypothetical protein B9Z55_026275 [Caenorhabditis nigoni]